MKSIKLPNVIKQEQITQHNIQVAWGYKLVCLFLKEKQINAAGKYLCIMCQED